MTHHPFPFRSLKFLSSLLVLVSLLYTPEATMAQDTTPPEDETTETSGTNPELQALEDEVARLTLEKQRAEALKAIAVANKAALEATLPDTDTTGKEGNVTVDDKAGYYAELMAYSTLFASAAEIGNSLAPKTQGKTVVVTDQTDLSQQAALWEVIHLKISRFQDDFDHLVKRFDKDGRLKSGLQEEGVAAAATILTSLLGAASDIAAFFRVDRELKGRTITLSERALVAEVARHLTAKKILVPDLAVAGDRPLIHQLNAAQDKKGEIVTLLEAARPQLAQATQDRDEKKERWEKLKKDKAPAAQIEEAKKAFDAAAIKVADWTRRVTRFETVIAAFDTFVNALSTAPAAGAKTPLETVAVVDLVRGDENSLLLYLDIASQGAEIHITKSAWRSGRVSYIGGSVAVFFLVNQKGEVQAAAALPRSAAASFKGKEGSEILPSITPSLPEGKP